MGRHLHDPLLSGEIVMNDESLTAGAVEISRAADVSTRMVPAGSTLTLTELEHEGRVIALDQADGSTVTLPAATGSGAVYKAVVTVTPTSNAHVIQVANATDEFAGVILQTDTDTSDTLASYPALAADNFDTITLNSGTTGGEVGDEIVIQDIATGVFLIKGHVNGSGVVATPLSAAVS